MSPEEYEIVARTFAEVCDLPTGRRAACLEKACREHPHLRAEIESMLVEDARLAEAATLADKGLPDRQKAVTGPAASDSTLRSSARIKEEFAGYELLEQIGRGGMGVVYKARQLQPSRTVALKMIRAGIFASQADIQRFHTEAEATANLEHEGIVPIYEVGERDGEHFFSMKFIEGESLAKRVGAVDLARQQAVELLKTVCDAVAHAHQQGIVHRDLKPSNILLDGKGRPWVTDFGLAKYLDRDSTLTAAGDVMGTPGYMSPEQAAGQADKVTTTSDVYSLGAILYEMLTGQPPIQVDTADRLNFLDVLQRIQEQEAAPPRRKDRRIPRDLDTICLKCLEKDPASRYPTAEELAADLGRYLEGEPILARPISLIRKTTRWARRQPGLATTWIAVVVFYLYHLVCRWTLGPSEISDQFHYACTGVAATWCVGAWFFQRLLNRSKDRAIHLFLWVTMEFGLLTGLLFATDGPTSGLTIVYHVLVAGVVLRGRTDLVGYATVLALFGYLSHVLCALGYYPKLVPSFMEALPFTISLGIIGLIQYLALRRCQTA